MARRLKQHELAQVMNDASKELREQLGRYPRPTRDLDRATYFEQLQRRNLLDGRWFGLHEAYGAVMDQRRWGPVAQARAHDALIEKAHAVWEQRIELSDELGPEASAAARDAYGMYHTGRLDALRAVSKAIAGYPERVRALPDIEHPERARQQTRERDRGAGY
jgi:hypothetical protein